jgi:short subunit dehydrogenase-like uncharacterized protein
MSTDTSYDLVLLGATGFTGALTADYLARNAPAQCRWALAGRDLQKLAAIRDRLAEVNPSCADLPLLRADVTDPASLRELAASTRVVLTTVGPYIKYGEALVAACADAGTDYVDLTGEPEFIDRMYVMHHARAKETGARIVHACGFDSIPHDLGVYFTIGQLPADVPIRVDGFVRAGGTFSGGTLESALTAFSRVRRTREVARARRRIEPRPADRKVHTPTGRLRRAAEVNAWAVPLPTVDPQVVARTAATLDRYGPDFTYRHYASVKRLPVAVGAIAGASTVFLLAQVGPARRWLMRRRKPGQGPSAAQRAKSWFKVRFVGEGGGRRVVAEVAGGDPGYEETAKMLAESALCLAFDALPQTSGQLTTAVAMGDALIERLTKAGIRFTVLESGPTSATEQH